MRPRLDCSKSRRQAHSLEEMLRAEAKTTLSDSGITMRTTINIMKRDIRQFIRRALTAIVRRHSVPTWRTLTPHGAHPDLDTSASRRADNIRRNRARKGSSRDWSGERAWTLLAALVRLSMVVEACRALHSRQYWEPARGAHRGIHFPTQIGDTRRRGRAWR